MNYIFVNVKELDEEYKVINRAINEKLLVKEICFSKIKLDEIITLKNNKEKFIIKRLINNLKIKTYIKHLNKAIIELRKDEENLYVLSKGASEYKGAEYIKGIFSNLKFIEYNYKGEYINNIPAHIKRFTEKVQKPVINTKVIMIYKDLDNIDMNVLQNLINNHKFVNILALDDVSKYQIKKVRKFNDNNGTTVSIINKNKKAFKEYDVALFMDCVGNEVKRLRFDVKALKLYVMDVEKDDLDKNNIYMQTLLKENKLLETIVEKLQSIYGQNTVASIITKLHKSIDKT